MDLSTTVLAAITQEVRAGRKIEAIKLYREATGVGLAEAKEFVERLEQGGNAPPRIAGAAPGAEGDRFAAVKAALRQSGKIQAIKIYRDLVPGTGLAEAKQAVETMEVALRAAGELPPQAASKGGCAGMLMMVGGAAFLLLVVLLLLA